MTLFLPIGLRLFPPAEIDEYGLYLVTELTDKLFYLDLVDYSEPGIAKYYGSWGVCSS